VNFTVPNDWKIASGINSLISMRYNVGLIIASLFGVELLPMCKDLEAGVEFGF